MPRDTFEALDPNVGGSSFNGTLIAGRVNATAETVFGIDTSGRAYYAKIPDTTADVVPGEEAVLTLTEDGRLHAVRPIGAS